MPSPDPSERPGTSAPAEPAAEPAVEPIDWDLAARVARRVAERQPGPAVDQTALKDSVAPLAARSEDLVEACTGLRSRAGPVRVEIVDRARWAITNVHSFRTLLTPFSQRVGDRLAGARSGAALGLTRRLAALELGSMLGYLSRRVLGQYDVLVAANPPAERSPDEPNSGDTVYLVGPNLVGIEAKFGFPPDEFRQWVTLHEVTHRAQFTGVSWMRDHYLALIGELLALTDPDPAAFFAAVRRAATDREDTRARLSEGGIAAVFATAEQRTALGRIAGLMALLEGHGDVTMTRAAGDLVPSAARFERVLNARRRQGNPLTKFFNRLVGFEAKMNQYEAGERFIAAVEKARGPHVIGACWVRPENLPDLHEIRDPDAWLERIDGAAA
jgi:coenzyme F420 biosynthesis associated uncharacterized protein